MKPKYTIILLSALLGGILSSCTTCDHCGPHIHRYYTYENRSSHEIVMTAHNEGYSSPSVWTLAQGESVILKTGVDNYGTTFFGSPELQIVFDNERELVFHRDAAETERYSPYNLNNYSGYIFDGRWLNYTYAFTDAMYEAAEEM